MKIRTRPRELNNYLFILFSNLRAKLYSHYFLKYNYNKIYYSVKYLYMVNFLANSNF